MKGKKHIAFFVTNDLVYDQRMQRICGALGDAGHQVKLVGRKLPSSKTAQFPNFQSKRFRCFFNKGSLFYAEINIRFFFFALFNKMDVLVANDLDTILPLVVVGKIKRLPIVFDAHEWFTEVPELEHKPVVRKVWSQIEKFCVPKASLRYTVNESLANIFSEKIKLPFEVIRNVPVKFQTSRVKKAEKTTIVYQGALNKGRGIEASIKAMQHLEHYQLWIAGEGDLSQELRDLTTALDLNDRVTFLGFQNPDVLKLMTLKAHVGLNLLEGESLNYYYSLANKFFDYMHAGIPSVNMTFPEYQKILSDFPCGHMIQECKPELIANTIKLICEDQSIYDELVEQSRAASEVFAWSKEKEKLVDLYHQL